MRSDMKQDDKLHDLSRKNPQVRKRIKLLRENHLKHCELEAKLFEERVALEAKYQKLYQPLYTKRYDIVNGVEVEQTSTETTKTEQEDDEPTDEKGVPNFWLTALKNDEILAAEISKRDEEALKFLKDIKWFRIEDPEGFKLKFFFGTNPYFKNDVLTKTYHTIDEDECFPVKAIGMKINWHVGNCLTQKNLKKKKPKKCKSFFNFFRPPLHPPLHPDNEDDAEEFLDLLEQDYGIGLTIRDMIIPHAVSWFTGVATDDEIEDEEDDEEEEKPKGRRNVHDNRLKSGRVAITDEQGEEEEKPKGWSKGHDEKRRKCGRVPITDD